ncbi:uncharacterized protein MICPUCDRAFT_70894 [Micromonas pusilla CCMP1545]|uniref:Predicted protein n=1 Tax=Micromonas pusilla (strain CCMP1545) TaxID=564608 RepID=C1MK98_MICPC|nr:uncharacterized protein MICPUCDRAFT_70894 [Micromonas pusilla CCMP1545]EEH59724.1 predicted protein [Micromonas pusilla CCMP1545]|eukprot:XP_003056348.1 predicted protein [Micromonas pusilla CCMP1545]
MGKHGQTMNKKRKTSQRAAKENGRALKLRKGGVDRNKIELRKVHRSNRPQVSGVSRTGKQARKQLKLARRADKEKTKRDEDEKTSGCAKKDVTGDVAMAD